jgi:hypothetical protein
VNGSWREAAGSAAERFCSRTSCHRQRGLSEFIYRIWPKKKCPSDKGLVILSLWFFITSFVTSQRHTLYDWSQLGTYYPAEMTSHLGSASHLRTSAEKVKISTSERIL